MIVEMIDILFAHSLCKKESLEEMELRPKQRAEATNPMIEREPPGRVKASRAGSKCPNQCGEIAPDRLSQQALGLTIRGLRSEEHSSELQSLMRISYAVFCLKKKNNK